MPWATDWATYGGRTFIRARMRVSWGAYYEAEFGASDATAYRVLQSARVPTSLDAEDVANRRVGTCSGAARQQAATKSPRGLSRKAQERVTKLLFVTRKIVSRASRARREPLQRGQFHRFVH